MSVLQLGIPQNLGHAQVGPDGQLLSAGILTGNQDLGDSQAQQYNLLAQYAAQLGTAHPLQFLLYMSHVYI